MTLQERIGGWVADFRLEHAPEEVIRAARGQILSVLGATFAGALSDEGQAVLRAADGWPAGPCPVWPGARPADRFSAVSANGALSCVFDFDDYLLVGHGGHSAVHVPLALAAEQRRSFGELLAAQIVANEVAGRLGLACFIGPQNGQQLPFIHQAGAAMAAGHLLGLGKEQLVHALGIALSQPPAPLWPAFLGGFGAKILVASLPAAHGLRAAELARAGMTAARDLLDHPAGFFHRFAFLPAPRVISGFGETWILHTLHIKPYPACAYHQSVYHLLDRYALGLEPGEWQDVAQVTLAVPFLAALVSAFADARLTGGRPDAPVTPNEANFSLTVGTAVALMGGRFAPERLTADWLEAHTREIRDLASRVRVVHDLRQSIELIRPVHQRLDVPAALGHPSLPELISAVTRARSTFPRVDLERTGFTPLLAQLPGIVGDLVRSSRHPYDLADHPLDGLRFGFSAKVTIEREGDTPWEQRLDHPPGAAADEDFLDLGRRKFLEQAERHLGLPRARQAAEWILTSATDAPVMDLLPLLSEDHGRRE